MRFLQCHLAQRLKVENPNRTCPPKSRWLVKPLARYKSCVCHTDCASTVVRWMEEDADLHEAH